jgi:hypothetical protein
VPELREIGRIAIPRIEVGGGIIRRKQHQRLEEALERTGLRLRQKRIGIAGCLCLAAVPQDDVIERNAAAIVSENALRARAPESASQESLLQGAVVIPLVEIRPEIVTLEISEDIFHHKLAAQWLFERRKSFAVVDHADESAGSSKQVIKNPLRRIVNSRDIPYSAIVVNLKIGDVTGNAAKIVKNAVPALCRRILPAQSRLEVVQQIEFEVIDKGWVDLILAGYGIGRRGGIDFILRPIQHHARGGDHRLSGISLRQVVIVAFEAHFLMERADDEFPN